MSGEVPGTPLIHYTSAWTHSYGSLTQTIAEHRLEGHRGMFHNRPQFVPTTSCRGIRVHYYTYGVSPQQVEMGQLLQRPGRG